MNGEILGDRYELLEKIGEGGMAVVYKARCNKLNRFVAVKILKDEYADNEEIVKKFKKEATAIAKLSDTNIVNVLDVGSEGTRNYIVMELVNGKTLKEAISEFGSLNYETAITIAIQVAKALECAHKNSIIHRDIKPQNILVTEEGLVKVTDFGIAKSSDSATLTNTSTILGSAHYFSPEQAKGAFIDERTDIYSLGIVMYEMVTGKLPFEADSPVTIALKHLQEQVVPPKELNSRVPGSLNKVILKCMEKDADNRYQNVKDLIADLQKIKANPDALIGEEELQNQQTAEHTIVMNAVKEPIVTAPKEDNNLEDEYYDDYDDYDDEDDDYYDEDDDYDDRKNNRKNKKGKGLFIGIGAAIIIVLLGVGAFFMVGGSGSKNVEVPNLIGMTMDEAEKAASAVDLRVVKVKEVKNEAKTGTIVESNPTAGSSVKKGSIIEVTVSGGEKIFMADLVEDELSDAKSKLESLGLKNIKVRYDYSDEIPEGKVMSQDPNSGVEIEKDTKITLVVSKGKKVETIKVPSLIGMSENDAKDKLISLGFKVSVETQATTDESKNGKVVGQSVDAGTTANPGDTVTLQVGNYKEEKISIGSIINTNMTGTQAVAALAAKGITNVSIDGNGSDMVASWTPDSATKGTQVTITTKADSINIGSKISQGMTGTEAKQILQSSGFDVSINGPEDGKVVSWTPDSAAKGGSVTITTKKDEASQTNVDDKKDNKNQAKKDKNK
ncbi:Stk1 family PASTA domain-containing Ser/Thr kinase [Clostridium baratii]|uniref:non-specific serine/threonine protein kinase n=1 Tax=Clostridium baratii TaxID=1561 RepID=A0A174QC30_9CLOT|nr:Stk1 family PASTA domain-containing Ser/Thr kinase [Clostridium baratii]CUP68285.1 serine/threonine-protein kinase PrkC [Clostridium baratii]